MTVPIGIAPANPISKSPSGAVAPVAQDQFGKDTFLKLLVAQLKYQNPTEPADGAEFMAQTAQFAMVEKLDGLAKNNADLLASNRALSASSLIGRSIVHADAAGKSTTATVTGVRFDVAGPVLLTGATEVPFAAVKEVRPAATT